MWKKELWKWILQHGLYWPIKTVPLSASKRCLNNYASIKIQNLMIRTVSSIKHNDTYCRKIFHSMTQFTLFKLYLCPYLQYEKNQIEFELTRNTILCIVLHQKCQTLPELLQKCQTLPELPQKCPTVHVIPIFIYVTNPLHAFRLSVRRIHTNTRAWVVTRPNHQKWLFPNLPWLTTTFNFICF